MSEADRYNIEDFTLANYARLIELAKLRYSFRSFTDCSGDDHFIVWRHDVDFCPPRALDLARIEAAAGVSATYFWHLHSKFYNLLEDDTVNIAKEIRQLGHDNGLHFDIDFHRFNDVDSLVRWLNREKRILEEVLDCPIESFSFHYNTTLAPHCQEDSYAGMVNATGRFFRENVGYCSDSNGYWRHDRLEDVLRSGKHERLQALTHPVCWQDRPMLPRDRVQKWVQDRAQQCMQWYDNFLHNSGRDNIQG
jgi:hypothetical protein